MIGRVLLAALLTGIAAGFIAGIIQHVRMTPLILQAETFEVGGVAGRNTHAHDPGAAAHSHDESGSWTPKDGIERTLYTVLTTALAGAGFAAVLTGVSFLLAIPITRDNGLIWGMCGFVAVALAPAAGLPPDLPGMASARLELRMAWWLMTIVFTAAALWLWLIKRAPWAIGAGLALLVAPHVIGAPQPMSHETVLSARLVQIFVANSLAANALMWSLIGLFLGFALNAFKDEAKP